MPAGMLWHRKNVKMIIRDTREHHVPTHPPPGIDGGGSAQGVLRGWLPIDLDSNQEILRWMQVRENFSLDEPFFTDSIRLARATFRPPPECDTDLVALETCTAKSAVCDPAGVIVHVSRCGSTVLSNALRATESAIVLSEAQPVDAMLFWAAFPTTHRLHLLGRFLPQLVSVFAYFDGLPGKRVVIKCGIGGGLAIPALRAIWPTVPFVVLIRHPEEGN
jgi:hypothetical protein